MQGSSRNGSAKALPQPQPQLSSRWRLAHADKPSPAAVKSAGSGLLQRPHLQRSPHSSPVLPSAPLSNDRLARDDDDAARKRPPALALREPEPRVSITDDPFFRQYENPQSARLARDLYLARAETNATAAEMQNLMAANAVPIKVNIAVIGARSTGKTTYIRRTMDLEDHFAQPSRTPRNFAVGRDLYAVRMFEYPPEELRTDQDGNVQWPADPLGPASKHIHGAVVLYDVTDARSWNPVRSVLNILQKSSVPCIVVSAKCDVPSPHRQLEPSKIVAALRASNTNVVALSTSGEVPESAVRSLVVLLRTMQTAARGTSPRPRSNTARSRHASPSPAASHTRAASEYSLSSTKSGFPLGDVAFLAYSLHSRSSPIHNAPNPSPSAHGSRTAPAEPGAPSTTSAQKLETKPLIRIDTQTSDSLNVSNSHQSPRSFYLDDSPRRGSAGSIESTGGITLAHSVDIAPEQLEYTFDELVDKLVMVPQSTADIRFKKTFLALYRLIASPSVLFAAISQRYTNNNKGNQAQPGEIDGQSDEQHLRIINQWITSYPGDFGLATVREQLESFCVAPFHPKEYAASIQQILMGLKVVSEDDDTRWGLDNGDTARPTTAHTFYSTSSLDDANDLRFLHSDPSSPDSSFGSPSTPRRRNASRAQVPSELDASVIFRSGSTVALTAMGPSFPSFTQAAPIHISCTASRQAALLTPMPIQPLTKTLWRAFIAQPDELIANELTRMDWIIFSSLRTRDLVRHITIPKHEQHGFKSLANVERAVDHFNHIAYWVANIVLFRDKPKHRAQALEKLMRVARHLRNLNNYNTLGAIVAGIHGSAVHRLASTKDLIPVQLQRDFMKLEILMGTSKGSAAYRLAWENTTGERIPFLPMVRKDLITVVAANKTFTGSVNGAKNDISTRKVNWSKFQIMGDILLSMQAAQSEPYSGFATNEDVKSLLLESIITKDDDKLYERSVYLEPGGQSGFGGAVDVMGMGRRRLTGWLNRTA